ncbi:type-4 ice-structuring protein-like [Genypterus blacodes]|uniref:type-4 ice-structuring protein-like n=1 Tax=Genypterus blacodes TaxID=154954 RepID=UPI003F7672C4
MKFSLIAALVVFALAQGSQAQVPGDIQRLTEYFEEMKNKMTEELNKMVDTQDLASQAQTFMESQTARLEPIAAQLQEKLKTISANVEEQIRPMTENVQAQVPPMMEKLQTYVDALLQQVAERTKAVSY